MQRGWKRLTTFRTCAKLFQLVGFTRQRMCCSWGGGNGGKKESKLLLWNFDKSVPRKPACCYSKSIEMMSMLLGFLLKRLDHTMRPGREYRIFIGVLGPLTLLAFISPLCCCNKAAADFADWAATPPMGWNSWDVYGLSVTENEVRANADYMATNLKQFGWEYVVVDIRWTVQNPASNYYNTNAIYTLDEFGRYIPAPNRFPSSSAGEGFKPLADYLHNQGLKFGIHIMRGVPRVAYDTGAALPNGYPIADSTFNTRDIPLADSGASWLHDMYGIQQSAAGQAYYNSIFQLYAGWGVDYVKVDDLSDGYTLHTDELSMIRSAIDATGRPIVLSTSPGPVSYNYRNQISPYANMWRVSGDLWDDWHSVQSKFSDLDFWSTYRSSGHWPDADMLPLGRIGIRAHNGVDRMSKLTHSEQRTMMSLWSIAKSPLMFGGDLPSNDSWTESLLTNSEVLNVNQHSSNNHQLFHIGNRVAWLADAPGGGKYLALFNAPVNDEFAQLRANASYTSPVITRATPGQSASLSVDITGKDRLYLLVSDTGDNNLADWADWVNMELHGPSGSLSLSDLQWVRATSGWGTPAVGHDVVGGSLTINGTTYTNGLGTHANSIIEYVLPSGYTSLTGIVGLDNDGAAQTYFNSSIQFFVTTSLDDYALPGEDFTIDLASLGLSSNVRVRDLWTHSNLGTVQQQFSTSLDWHDARIYWLVDVPTLPGDFNADGVVDTADYVVWRSSLGSHELLAADGNGDFVIDEADFQVWRDHFGESLPQAGATGLAAAIPEPEPVLGMCSAIPLFLCFLFRHRGFGRLRLIAG